jgi:hypothetical protein
VSPVTPRIPPLHRALRISFAGIILGTQRVHPRLSPGWLQALQVGLALKPWRSPVDSFSLFPPSIFETRPQSSALRLVMLRQMLQYQHHIVATLARAHEPMNTFTPGPRLSHYVSLGARSRREEINCTRRPRPQGMTYSFRAKDGPGASGIGVGLDGAVSPDRRS